MPRRKLATLAGAAWLAGATAIAPACGARAPSALAGDDESIGDAGGDDGGGGGGGLFASDGAPNQAPLGDSGCATSVADAQREPAYLMFVLDGSDSMAQENKWTAATGALTSIFAEMQTAADPGVAAGLIVFPASGGPYPASGDVPLAFVDAKQDAALDTRLMSGLALGTPTESAMQGGYGELETFQPEAPLLPNGKKVLILITDGVPTDACASLLGGGNDSSNACVMLAASELAEAASKGGPIETFVIGVGEFPSKSAGQFDPAFLGYVAQAGGTGPAGCNPGETSSLTDLCYFEIDPSTSTASALQAKFQTALDAIRGKVVTCTFPLQSTGLGQINPALVNVEVNGTTILQDPKNGWTYDDPANPTAVVLNGAACTGATTVSAKVQIVVGCATMVK